MKPREYVLQQLDRRPTSPVPYTLGFEGDVGDRLDEHYGGKDWRERLQTYIVGSGLIDSMR